MAFPKHTQDPSAVLDHLVDWSQWLQASEVIVGHLVKVDQGIVVETSTASDDSVVIWLGPCPTGGTVTCQIQTNQGRIDERSFTLVVKDT